MGNGSTGFHERPRPCSKRVSDGCSIDVHSPLKNSSSTIDIVCMKLFQERKGETTATALPSWPLTQVSAADAPDLVLGNISEKRKKSDSSTACRLFGIDLVSHSRSTNPVHIPISASQDPVPAAASVDNSEQQSEVSKVPWEEKPVQQVSPKEIQGGQNCSTRSCTKVNRLITEFTVISNCELC